MKNRILITALMLVLAAALVKAQGSGANREVVSLPDGGFVSFKNETMWTELRQAIRLQQLPAPLNSQSLADRNQIVHRVLRDRDGRFVFGYDLWVTGDATTKKFKIGVKPLAEDLASSLRTDEPATAGAPTFPKATEPQILDDGAEFSLDLLINKTTGVKIVDVVKVSFDRTSLGGDGPIRARDFTADAVAMEMKDFSLMVNNELIATGKSKTGSGGAVLWLYVPQRGRFIFSLVPRPDYAFEKVGTVSGNKIEFSLRGDHFEWLSSAPILHEEGSWNLWVLSDPKYLPLIGDAMSPPPQEKSTLEKLSDKYHSLLDPSPPKVQTQHGGLVPSILDKMEKNKLRLKVMFGAADSIENLLPRN
jgi:hypothetical protein